MRQQQQRRQQSSTYYQKPQKKLARSSARWACHSKRLFGREAFRRTCGPRAPLVVGVQVHVTATVCSSSRAAAACEIRQPARTKRAFPDRQVRSVLGIAQNADASYTQACAFKLGWQCCLLVAGLHSGAACLPGGVQSSWGSSRQFRRRPHLGTCPPSLTQPCHALQSELQIKVSSGWRWSKAEQPTAMYGAPPDVLQRCV